MAVDDGLLSTTDHEAIRRWAERRGGRPALQAVDGGVEPRIDFPGHSGIEGIRPVRWEDFFAEFDRRDLAMVYAEDAGGTPSRYFRFVSRESVPT